MAGMVNRQREREERGVRRRTKKAITMTINERDNYLERIFKI